MPLRTPRARTLAAVAAASAIGATGVAFGHVGGVGTGLPPTTDAPDLRSVKLETVDLTDALPERAQFCFDQSVRNPGGGFVLHSYDTQRAWTGTGAADTTNDSCVIASFPAGSDIRSATVGAVNSNAVTNVAGKGNIVASEPVQGSNASPVAGRTTGPDLIGVQVDNAAAGTVNVTFQFDETLNPNPTRADNGDADADFYVTQTGDTIAAGDGDIPQQPQGSTLTVRFPDAAASATRFLVQPGAVEDRPQNFAEPGKTGDTDSPIGVFERSQPAGRPNLIRAEPAGANAYRIVFDRAIQFGPGAAGAFRAVADDGATSAVGSSVGSGGSGDSLIVTFPNGAFTDDPSAVVKIVAASNAVATQGDASSTSIADEAAVSTANDKPGYTNGPDLLSVSLDPPTNRATFVYDEPVGGSPGGGSFTGFTPDTTPTSGQGAGSIDGAKVTVNMGAGLSSLVAFGQGRGAVADKVGRLNPTQSVSKDVEQAPAPPPAPPTTATTETPAPPAVQPPALRKFATSVSIKRKRGTYRGKLGSTGRGCKSGRRVVLRRAGKGTKAFGTAFSKGNGDWVIKRRRKLPGRVYAVANERRKGAVLCRVGKSKTIR